MPREPKKVSITLTFEWVFTHKEWKEHQEFLKKANFDKKVDFDAISVFHHLNDLTYPKLSRKVVKDVD